jgi:hypothetical protein
MSSLGPVIIRECVIASLKNKVRTWQRRQTEKPQYEESNQHVKTREIGTEYRTKTVSSECFVFVSSFPYAIEEKVVDVVTCRSRARGTVGRLRLSNR